MTRQFFSLPQLCVRNFYDDGIVRDSIGWKLAFVSEEKIRQINGSHVMIIVGSLQYVVLK